MKKKSRASIIKERSLAKKRSNRFFFYAKHPAYTMRYHWLPCRQLKTRTFKKFGKMAKSEDAIIARKMLYYSGQLMQYAKAAFKANTYNEAIECVTEMQKAKSNCWYYHYMAQKEGLYIDFADEYKILKPITDMGYYWMALKEFFKRKFYPPKAVARLQQHYTIRHLLGYKPRQWNRVGFSWLFRVWYRDIHK